MRLRLRVSAVLFRWEAEVSNTVQSQCLQQLGWLVLLLCQNKQ